MTEPNPGFRAKRASVQGAVPGPHPGRRERLAVVATLIWLICAAVPIFGFWGDAGIIQRIALALSAMVPLGLIWMAALSLRQLDHLRAEAAQLRLAAEGLRHDYLAQVQTAAPRAATGAEAAQPVPAPAAQATFASRRDPAQAPRPASPAPAEEQPALALEQEFAPEPVAASDLIRALNFPDSPDDHDGIRALRRALANHDLAKLIRASQDVLILLGEDGIFMDDLVPDRAHPDLWRRFAGGERGRTIAPLGGIRDRSSLALSAARMRQDTIFRDAAHHFLRQFDRSFQSFEKTAGDGEIAAFTDTRTARAFMLLGRVSGTFD